MVPLRSWIEREFSKREEVGSTAIVGKNFSFCKLLLSSRSSQIDGAITNEIKRDIHLIPVSPTWVYFTVIRIRRCCFIFCLNNSLNYFTTGFYRALEKCDMSQGDAYFFGPLVSSHFWYLPFFYPRLSGVWISIIFGTLYWMLNIR